MSIHQTALYAGIIMSGYLAGWIADNFGWRIAFYIFGGFGYFIVIANRIAVEGLIPYGIKGKWKQ